MVAQASRAVGSTGRLVSGEASAQAPHRSLVAVTGVVNSAVVIAGALVSPSPATSPSATPEVEALRGRVGPSEPSTEVARSRLGTSRAVAICVHRCAIAAKAARQGPAPSS